MISPTSPRWTPSGLMAMKVRSQLAAMALRDTNTPHLHPHLHPPHADLHTPSHAEGRLKVGRQPAAPRPWRRPARPARAHVAPGPLPSLSPFPSAATGAEARRLPPSPPVRRRVSALRISAPLRPPLPEGPAAAYLASASRSAAAAGRGGGDGRAAPPLLTAAPRRLGAGPGGLGARLRLPPAAASPCSLR